MASQQQQQQDDDENIAKILAQDRPTIEQAIKSFISLFAARALTTPQDQQQSNITTQQALLLGRRLIKSINAFRFPPPPITTIDDGAKEKKVIMTIWNGLRDSDQKPCKYLGRKCLLYVWPMLNAPKEEEKDVDSSFGGSGGEHSIDHYYYLFWKEFGGLMQQADMTMENVDNDAALIWSSDGGQEELAKRRQRRQEKQESGESKSTDLPLIEEIIEE